MRRLLATGLLLGCTLTAAAQAPANVIIFLADDLGYGDVGPHDHDQNPLTPDVTNTPVLDQLATEGVRMTHFYANSSICSPTRAALLTGRHSIRSGITYVFTASSTNGLPSSEITIAEMLEPLGYRTGVVGKWHLGAAFEFLPLQQGFDQFYGVPYSNNVAPLPLMRGNSVLSPNADQTALTSSFTTEAVAFIDAAVAASEPFFLYVPYTAPHVPLFVSQPFENITGRGLYADCVFEMDDSIGQILARLDLHGIAGDTFVMFTSDNGACNNGTIKPEPGMPGSEEPLRWACGDNAPFAGYKFGFLEGGLRVPFIARWPGVLPAGVERETVGSVLDLLPTVATLTGATPPEDRPLDGEDLFGILTVDAPRQLSELHFYAIYLGAQWGTRTLVCTRRDTWKQSYNTSFSPLGLFDLGVDPGETQALAGPLVGTLWDRSRDFDCTLDEPLLLPASLNLASRRPTLASSSVGCETSSRAVDSDPTTLWRSGLSQDQVLQVDLGASANLQRVILDWGSLFARQYQLEGSLDGQTWQLIHSEATGNGGRDIIATGLSARYIRVRCMQSSGEAYGLREFSVQAAKLPDVFNAAK